jgi:hypothetical protein
MPLDKRVAISLTANPAQNARANNVAQVQVYHCDDPYHAVEPANFNRWEIIQLLVPSGPETPTFCSFIALEALSSL